MLQAGRAAELLERIRQAPEAVQGHGRTRLYGIQALIAVDRLDEAKAHLQHAVELVDVREGETSLSDLWFTIQEQHIHRREGVPVDDALRARVRRDFPPPGHLDFRQTT